MPHGRRDCGRFFEAVLTNKPFILNAYHSISREQIENYLFKLTYALIADVVREQAEGTGLSEDATNLSPIFINTVSSASCWTGSNRYES